MMRPIAIAIALALALGACEKRPTISTAQAAELCVQWDRILTSDASTNDSVAKMIAILDEAKLPPSTELRQANRRSVRWNAEDMASMTKACARYVAP